LLTQLSAIGRCGRGPGRKTTNVHQFGIDRTLLKLTQSEHLVTERSQRTNNCKIAALIREKSHPDYLFSAQWKRFFMGHRVRGVGEAGTHVRLCDPGVRVEQISHRCAFGQFAEDKFHWDASITDYWLTQHHRWIDLDALGHE